MELKYNKERFLLLQEIYSKKNFILEGNDLINFKKRFKMKDDDFEEMIEILQQRGFISIGEKIIREGTPGEDGYKEVTITFSPDKLELTKKGLNYIEERLEK